ncbi:YtfJ family protein [Myxococcaceae bacterium GXIMD 01537]
MRAWIAGALTFTLATGGARADEPVRGPMDATLRSSAGQKVSLSRWRGKPVILFYEDKKSTALNARLKEQLFKRGKERGLLDAAFVVAVANLEAYDFFPARQIALSYVRDEEKKVGVPILVDLDGTLGAAPWGLPKKTSNVLLLDGEGKLVFRHSGQMKEAEVEAFFGTLGKLIGVDMGTEKKP